MTYIVFLFIKKSIDLPKLQIINIGRCVAGEVISDLSISNLPSLHSIHIGKGSFSKLKSLTVSHNPKLKRFDLENGSKTNDYSFSNIEFLKILGSIKN